MSFIDSEEKALVYQNLANRMKVPPLWLFAKQQGVQVSMHHWPMANGGWCGHLICDDQDQVYSVEKVAIEETTKGITRLLSRWSQKKRSFNLCLQHRP